jgi:hypothetical protein
MGRIIAGLLLVLAVAGGAAAFLSSPAEANDIAPFETVFNTDVAYAGYGGMRTIGTGQIDLTGVSGTVTRALLYWHGPTDTADTAAGGTVSFGGTDITGTNIGLSSDNCWGFQNSQAYYSDVTSLVTGDGSYALAGFTDTSVEINGASLIVFSDDGDDSNNRDVVLFHGNDSNVTDNGFDADGWNVNLPGINYTSGSASMDLHVADGQTFDDTAIVLNGSVTLDAGPAIFQGDTVPNGASAANTDGGLWDIRSFDVTSALVPGNNDLTLTTGYIDDCLSLIVAAVNLPAGAAPGQPTPTAEPATATGTAVPPTATTAAIGLPDTGTGASSDGSVPVALLALLGGLGIALSAGYAALKVRAGRA